MSAPGTSDDVFGLVGKTMRDIASGVEGELPAIRCEQLPTHTGTPAWTRRAYLLPPGQDTPLTTAPGNIRPTGAR
ncbi:hypothetical protein [Streptomyces cinereoruber]|uniref:hypothetical protein n=1 Tax=Streptomyces cinereoruber TaxID=67260 RepID=UPI003C2CE060